MISFALTANNGTRCRTQLMNKITKPGFPSSRGSIIPSVLCQFSENATFFWIHRQIAIHSPHFSLRDLTRQDSRLDACLDGLRIASDEGWQLCKKELSWRDAGEVFVAAVLAFDSEIPDRITEVLNVGTGSLQLSRGIVSALSWLGCEQVTHHIDNLFAADSGILRCIGTAAFAIHRKDPGQLLPNAICAPEPLLRARALRAVGELGRIDLVPLARHALAAKDDGSRFWAAWSIALVSGYMTAVQVLQAFAESAGPFGERALQLGLRRLDTSRAHDWNRQLARRPQSARLSVIGAGIIGDPVLVPWLIQQMAVPPMARIAGEAFTMVTGIDLAYQDLDCKKPEGFESGPNEDPNDENVEMDRDEKLPWPNAELIGKWWDEHKSEFQNGVRYLLGKPIREEWMREVLRIGRQRQRAAAALELAIMRPGEPLFEVRAPGFRQQKMLQRLTAT
jgi:uncharacterized protein (TIGR02270 family)